MQVKTKNMLGQDVTFNTIFKKTNALLVKESCREYYGN